MSKSILIIISRAIVLGGIVASCTSASSEKPASQPTEQQKIKRGEYLVSIIGCDDCHSPKRMGAHEPEVIPELRLSGYNKNLRLSEPDTNQVNGGWMMFAPDLTAAVGPWGMSFAANLTPDATGIGNWKEENFILALREGKFKGDPGNRNLLPPMPWFVYKNMTDEDLRSIYAYLRTLKPVENRVPAPIPFSELGKAKK